MAAFPLPARAFAAAADWISGAAHRLSEAAGRPVETAGNAIEGAAERGGAAGRWAGHAAGGLFQFAATAIRAALNVAGNCAGGVVRIAGGIVALDLPLVRNGLGDIGASLLGAAAALLVTLTAAVQTAVGLQSRARPLREDEREMLRAVYRGSVDLRPVRIVEGRTGLLGLTARPFTLGNRIYMKGSRRPRTLVHEACHVWQNQHVGLRYAGDALWAQLTYGQRERGAYDWRAEYERGKEWPEFNAEAQASFLDTVFADGRRGGKLPGRGGDFYDGEPVAGDAAFGDAALTAFARRTVDAMRAG